MRPPWTLHGGRFRAGGRGAGAPAACGKLDLRRPFENGPGAEHGLPRGQPIKQQIRGRSHASPGPWDNGEAYTRNSPVRYAKTVTSPLLMLHNDADGAVDFTQGVEYYNTLRRLDKPVWMVEYPGENHGLARQPNMQDYMIRMKEFFDHYLMDKAAPAWMTDGIPRLKMNDDVTARLKAREDAKKKKGGSGGS